jgi:60 kDa SS-A/Ro ribonucleoprotein
MAYTALIRHVGRMAAAGVLSPESPATALAVARLIDRRRVANSRVSPIAVLGALHAYRQSSGEPTGVVVQALEEAFRLALDNVEPTSSRIYLAIDASASMAESMCAGMPQVPASAAAAALAMMFTRKETRCTVAAFNDRIRPVNIEADDRLVQACQAIGHSPRDTDGSLPMVDALERGIAVDAFVIVTDDESWAGDRHPAQALERYRRTTGIAAKLVVISMAAGRCGIADPDDAFQIDVAGFDATVPGVVSDFIRGRLP